MCARRDFELAHRVGDVRHGVDEQPHAQLRREAARQIELGSLRAVPRRGNRRSADCASRPAVRPLRMICSSTVGGCEQVPSSSVAMMARATFKWAPRSGRERQITPAPARTRSGYSWFAVRSSGSLFRAGAGIESPPLTERYRSGHNGTDSKSVEGITSLRGFESHPLRHFIFAKARCAGPPPTVHALPAAQRRRTDDRRAGPTPLHSPPRAPHCQP